MIANIDWFQVWLPFGVVGVLVALATLAYSTAEWAVDRRKSKPGHANVCCPVCWANMLEDHYSPHYRWHVREGHVDGEAATESKG